MPEATIIKSLSGFYDVFDEGNVIRCRARGLFRKTGVSPLVGDRVRYTPPEGDSDGTITEILPRFNSFVRSACANIDRLIIIAAAVNPVTDPFLIDRMTAVCESMACEPVICLNKCDLDRGDTLCANYNRTGYPVIRTSAVTGEGVDELRELLRGKVCAFSGNSGVGKSSLLNFILGEERVIVSNVAGTTRDAIDSYFENDYGKYVFIDTAGMRKKKAIEDASLERYSVLRSIAAIRRCHVALLLLDAGEGVTEQDTKIAGLIKEEGKACVIIVNKWDTIEKATGTLEKTKRQILSDLKFMDYCPVLFISSLTGQRVNTVLSAARDAYAMACRRITTGLLNDVLNEATNALQPPLQGGRRLKIYYATQQDICPPTFLLFVNDEELMFFAYERYLENYFRKTFGFTGTPIRFQLRQRKSEQPGG